MATIRGEDRDFVDKLISGNGRMPEDQEDAQDNPRCVKIVEFIDQGGKVAYGLVFEYEMAKNRYDYSTPYIINPRIIWEYQLNQGE